MFFLWVVLHRYLSNIDVFECMINLTIIYVNNTYASLTIIYGNNTYASLIFTPW